jgi:hypothetical protein
LRFGIKSDVAGDDSANEPGIDKLADPSAWHRRVIRYHGQVAFALSDELIHQRLGSADPHEATDHERGTVRNLGYGGGGGNRLHRIGLGIEPRFVGRPGRRSLI